MLKMNLTTRQIINKHYQIRVEIARIAVELQRIKVKEVRDNGMLRNRRHVFKSRD